MIHGYSSDLNEPSENDHLLIFSDSFALLHDQPYPPPIRKEKPRQYLELSGVLYAVIRPANFENKKTCTLGKVQAIKHSINICGEYKYLIECISPNKYFL